MKTINLDVTHKELQFCITAVSNSMINLRSQTSIGFDNTLKAYKDREKLYNALMKIAHDNLDDYAIKSHSLEFTFEELRILNKCLCDDVQNPKEIDYIKLKKIELNSKIFVLLVANSEE